MRNMHRHDPYLELARWAVDALMADHAVGECPPEEHRNELYGAIADYLRDGNSVISIIDHPCGCETLARRFVAHGQLITVRYHDPSCTTIPGCDCGCYKALDEELGDGLVSLMDGVPDEAGLANRAQRRAARRKGCVR